MINKQVIFNVGGALSSYLEFNGNKIIIDLGKSDDFNPVTDFLLPVAEAKKFDKSIKDVTKFNITQTFLSHLDNDHISAIEEFDKNFFTELLTVPCIHSSQNNIFNVVVGLFTDKNKNRDKVLELMKVRVPGYGEETQADYERPLVVHKNCLANMQMYHIPAGICGNEKIFNKKDHSNNSSIVLFIQINGHKIFMPGDLMKEGMEYLINNNIELKNSLQNLGVDFLIAPHHGLTTSFPDILFKTMKNNKTNRLNIISEKIRRSLLGENRSDVDGRYYGDLFCVCNNNLNRQGGIKTSGGHIVIDYSSEIPNIKIIKTEKKEELIKEFI